MPNSVGNGVLDVVSVQSGSITTVSSHVRQSVSNRRQLSCLFDSLLKPTNKISKGRITGPCAWNEPVTTDSPHKGLVLRKALSCQDAPLVPVNVFIFHPDNDDVDHVDMGDGGLIKRMILRKASFC